ncbi:MAG TPA: carbonic anhydrase [Candidatus Methanoperedens sp.]
MVIIRNKPIKILIAVIVMAALLATGCVDRVENLYNKPNIGAGPITPWSKEMMQPDIELSAFVHPQASVIGDVYIGKNVMVSPQAAVRGDEGSPIHVGNDSNIQDGAAIHALETKDEEGNPVEKNLVDVGNKKYAVYIGDRVSLAHQSQVHGPASIGDDTFVGMQAFVFKSKVGSNVVLEPGVKIVGVTIPDGRYVPLGMVVNNQSVADALPVITEDYVFKDLNKGVVHVNTNLAKGYNSMNGKTAQTESEGHETGTGE